MIWIPEDNFDECSKSTEDLGLIYKDTLEENCCDLRSMNYYPLLDNIVAWMDEEYADDAPVVA